MGIFEYVPAAFVLTCIRLISFWMSHSGLPNFVIIAQYIFGFSHAP